MCLAESQTKPTEFVVMTLCEHPAVKDLESCSRVRKLVKKATLKQVYEAFETESPTILVLKKPPLESPLFNDLIKWLKRSSHVQVILLAEDWSQHELLDIVNLQLNIKCFLFSALTSEDLYFVPNHNAQDWSKKVDELNETLFLRRKQFEEMYELVLQQQSKLDAILTNLPVMMFVINQEGIFTLAEGKSLSRMGLAPGELVGNTIEHDKATYLLPYFLKALCGENSRFTTETQSMYLETLMNPMRNSEGEIEGVIGISFDVTAQKEIEHELIIAKKKAEDANKAKTSYLANMSHEIRTPLNAILGFAQILNRKNNLTPDQKEHITGIILGGEHLLKLINNVLDLAKIEAKMISENPIFFNSRQFFYGLESIFKHQFSSKGLQFKVELAHDLPHMIYADENILRQVTVNLLGNALKFTEAGQVSLKVKTTQEHEAQILSLQVDDSGIGIPQEDIDTIFNEFQQSRTGVNAKDGTGLGLAISHRLLQLIGGDISVKSTPHCGTSFFVNLPVKYGHEHTLMNHLNQDEVHILHLAPQQPEMRILIVDDHQVNCEILSELLTMVGYEVKINTSSKEALNTFDHWQPHAVLLDRQMPEMDGLEVARQLRKRPGGTATRIIMISASAFEEERAEVYAEGVDEFLSKPYKDTQVYQVLAEQLGAKYITKEETTPSLSQPTALIEELNSLKGINPLLLEDLHRAVINSDFDEILTLVECIESEVLQKTLKKMVHGFEYEKLLELIQSTKDAYNER